MEQLQTPEDKEGVGTQHAKQVILSTDSPTCFLLVLIKQYWQTCIYVVTPWLASEQVPIPNSISVTVVLVVLMLYENWLAPDFI